MLSCDALQVSLGTFALGPITACAQRGDVTVVVGPNASGKTTLLRAAAGVLRPHAGTVSVGNRPLHTWNRGQLASQLAFVDQHIAADVPLSVEQVVSLARLRRSNTAESARRIAQAMAALSLDDLRHRPLGALSVGQRQRVHLARALAQIDPDGVLVLDEPTAPLDPDWSCRVWGLLRAFAQDGGSVLASVHDLPAASVVANAAWLINGGQLVASGAQDDMLCPESLASLFGVPFVALGDGSLPVPAWLTA